ncbi:hypothetical protein Tco_0054403 [Tanacetum coccineum]
MNCCLCMSWLFLSSRFRQTHQQRAWGRPLLELSCSARSLLLFQPLHPLLDLPATQDDTPLILIDTPTISPILPTIPLIAPTIQYTSSFVCTNSPDSDTPDTPLSPIHDIPPAEISPSIRHILPAPPGLPHRLAILVLPGQPIPVGRPSPIRETPPVVMQCTTLPSHSRVILNSIHNDDGNPTSANIKQALQQLKNIKKDDNKSFKDEEMYEHVGPKVTSLQEGERLQDVKEIMFD